MKPLSDRQAALLQFVRGYVESHGYPPSMREIAESLGKSVGSVHYQFQQLQAAGRIRRSENRPRAFGIVDNPAGRFDDSLGTDEQVLVPVLRRNAAGVPVLAEGLSEDVFPLPRQLVGHGSHFLLRVHGDSMVDAAILDGDWVVVRQQPRAESDETVAAMLEGGATIKVLQRRNGHVWLFPRNQHYDPTPADGAQILGVVVAVLRRI